QIGELEAIHLGDRGRQRAHAATPTLDAAALALLRGLVLPALDAAQERLDLDSAFALLFDSRLDDLQRAGPRRRRWSHGGDAHGELGLGGTRPADEERCDRGSRSPLNESAAGGRQGVMRGHGWSPGL